MLPRIMNFGQIRIPNNIRIFKNDEYAELITGPVFTAKGCIRPFLGYLGRFWPVFDSQRQYFLKLIANNAT